MRPNVAKDNFSVFFIAHDDFVYTSISADAPTRSVGLDDEIGDEDLAVIARD